MTTAMAFTTVLLQDSITQHCEFLAQIALTIDWCAL